MMRPTEALRRWCLQLTGVLVLSGGLLIVLAPGAAADNCDLRINPEDCQNTAWTIGTAGAIAATAAVAAVVVASKPDQAASTPADDDGLEWVRTHVRAAASDGGSAEVAVVESPAGDSPPTAVIRIVPHVDAGTQVVEEVEE
jgi:hypothetical protein